jgi:hypothetical protein
VGAPAVAKTDDEAPAEGNVGWRLLLHRSTDEFVAPRLKGMLLGVERQPRSRRGTARRGTPNADPDLIDEASEAFATAPRDVALHPGEPGQWVVYKRHSLRRIGPWIDERNPLGTEVRSDQSNH